MSGAHADRNLLFGILAVQMDFVGRDELLVAMAAWVLQKERPLGNILVEQGVLANDTHELLDALVQKHLQAHGNDPQRSLAAVSSVTSVCHELGQLSDPDIGASLAHVPKATDDLQNYDTLSVGKPTSTGQRFRILRPHARGGLGEVHVAEDLELHRKVALKEIQDQYADHADSRARFTLEAEITGGLEHPGIVPVYGLGQYADGRPFYAMRFIHGDSLKHAIEQFHQADAAGNASSRRTLALRKLLGRFIDVCYAIEYAHSRGVLHRDLKPGNIMLGKYGETLVVDWGLAKLNQESESPASTPTYDESLLKPKAASGSTPTQMGSALGTPSYMSPEQAAGRLDVLGPASDVYSLGATLYCLLTSRPPVETDDVGSILRRVQEGDFPPPRAVDRRVPRALEAICLKAMALAADDRYASPRELADEVERWLADDYVSAYREPLPARVGRFARRHRAGAQAAAASW